MIIYQCVAKYSDTESKQQAEKPRCMFHLYIKVSNMRKRKVIRREIRSDIIISFIYYKIKFYIFKKKFGTFLSN